MRLAVLAVLVLSSTASARRAPPDFKRFDPPDICPTGKTMKAVTTCLAKHGKPSIIHDTAAFKLVRVDSALASGSSRVHVYAARDRGWWRIHHVDINATNEIVSIGTLQTPSGDALRLDVGITMRTNVSVDQLTTEPGLLRRQFSHVCLPAMCHSLMTACETYVDGKAYHAFRAEIVWHQTLGLRLRGKRTAAGGMCTVPVSLLLDQ